MNAANRTNDKALERWPIPPSWKWVRAKDIAAIVGGGTPRESVDEINYDPDGVPWLTPADLTGYTAPYIERGRRSLSAKGLANSAARLMPSGTVLLSSRAPVGYCVIARSAICTNQGFKNFVLYDRIAPEFVRYYLISARDYLRSRASGTTFLELSGSAAGQLEFPVAPLNEQRRIVEKIDELFSLIEAGEQALARARTLLERYRQSVLNAAVTGELTKAWRERHEGEIESGEALLKRILKARRDAWEKAELAKMHARGKPPADDRWKEKYKEPQPLDTANLPELPEGWVWASLAMLTDIVGGMTVDAKRTGPDLQEVPYLRVANVQRGRLDLSEVKKLLAPSSKIDELRLLPGDLLLNEGGDRDKIGRGWIWEGQIGSCIHQNHVFRARPFTFEIPSKYISYYANEMGRDYFFSQGKQTTNLASINLTKVSRLPVPVPSADEASQIVELIDEACSVVDHVISDAGLQHIEADRLRQSILAAAFSGKLVPQDPADEPAAALLERIRVERAKGAATPEQRPGNRRQRQRLLRGCRD